MFDRIAAVEERYGNGPRASEIEVFKLRRPVKRLERGKKLRITAENGFEVTWSTDGWKTVRKRESSSVGYAGSFADLDPGDAEGLSFTLFWPGEGRWEGRNFDVEIESSR